MREHSSGGSRRWWGSGAEGLGLDGVWCGRGTSGMSQLHHPSVLQSQKQRGDSAEVGSFLVPHRVPSNCASAPHACMHWCPARVGEETKGMSIARCAPPHSGRPVAMTSIRLSSWVPTWSMILVLVVTLAPASLPILAAARSRGPPRLRKVPAWAQIARWSPKGSTARRHQRSGKVGVENVEGAAACGGGTRRSFLSCWVDKSQSQSLLARRQPL